MSARFPSLSATRSRGWVRGTPLRALGSLFRDGAKRHPVAVSAGQIDLDPQTEVAVAQQASGVAQVLELGGEEGVGILAEAAGVVGAAVVGDQHGAAQVVRLYEGVIWSLTRP